MHIPFLIVYICLYLLVVREIIKVNFFLYSENNILLNHKYFTSILTTDKFTNINFDILE